jgi:hypothetical protein
LLDEALGRSKGVPYAGRIFVLLANRLTCPKSEHGLARWPETDFVRHRQGQGYLAGVNPEPRLKEAGVDLSAPDAPAAPAAVRLVTFHLAGRPVRRGTGGSLPHARQVLKALAIRDLEPPTPLQDQSTVT